MKSLAVANLPPVMDRLPCSNLIRDHHQPLLAYARVLCGHVLRNEDFANDKVDAGDIGAGHTVTAFYELTPPGVDEPDKWKYQPAPTAAGTDEWMTVKLRYKHPDGDESSKTEFALTGEAAPIEKTDADFRFATAVAMFGMKAEWHG